MHQCINLKHVKFILLDPHKDYPADGNPVFMRGDIDAYWGGGGPEQ